MHRHPSHTVSIALVRPIAGQTIASAVGHDGHGGKVGEEVDAARRATSGKRLLPGSEAGSWPRHAQIVPDPPHPLSTLEVDTQKKMHKFKPLAINLIDLYLIYFWARG